MGDTNIYRLWVLTRGHAVEIYVGSKKEATLKFEARLNGLLKDWALKITDREDLIIRQAQGRV